MIEEKHEKYEKEVINEKDEEDKMGKSIGNYFDQKQKEITAQREQKLKESYKDNYIHEKETTNYKTTQKLNKNSPQRGMPYKFNKMSDREREYYFLSTYDENDQLKKELIQMKDEIKILNTKHTLLQNTLGIKGEEGDQDQVMLMTENIKMKEKLLAMSQAKSVIKQKNQQHKPDPQKSLYSTHNFKATSTNQQEQENQKLVKINDALKNQLQKADVQLKAMQDTFAKTQSQPFGSSKLMQEQNVTMQVMRSKLEELETRTKLQSQQLEQYKINYLNQSKALKDEKQKTNDLETQLKFTLAMNKNAVDYEKEIENLRKERNDLDQKVRELSQAPFIREHTDQVSLKEEIHRLAQNLEQTKQENAKLKEKLTLTETEYDFVVKKNADLQKKYDTAEETRINAESEMKLQEMNWLKGGAQGSDNDEFFRKLGTMRMKGEQPAWSKLDFIDQDGLDVNDPKKLLKENERLRIEKGDLADSFEKQQTQYRTLKENAEEIQRQNQIEIKGLQLQLDQASKRADDMAKIANLQNRTDGVHEMKGLKYDGDVLDFSIDSTEMEEISPDENIFDLYISEVMLDEMAITQIISNETSGFFDKLDVKSILTFLTIDFYKHETVNSSIVEGLNANYACQVGFNVNCNDAFFKYLSCGQITIEIYASQGLEPIKLGFGNIELHQLVEQNQNNGISAVINSALSLTDAKDQLLGILQFKMRMRFPIAQSLKWIKEKEEIGLKLDDNQEIIVDPSQQRRTIEIVIEKALLNTSSNIKSFVFYQFQEKDFPTKVLEGKEPNWNYHQSHLIVFNKEFISYIKNNELEFTILDDQASLRDIENGDNSISDFIGSATISLQPLLRNDTINAIIEIKGRRGEKKGSLQIKIFWFDKKLLQVPPAEAPDSIITKAYHNELKIMIGNAMHDRELTVQSAFKMFDNQNINFVALNQFSNMIVNIFNLPVMKEQVQSFYQTLPQPLDFDNFERIFGGFMLNEQQYKKTYEGSQFPQMHQMLQENTRNLTEKIDSRDQFQSSYQLQSLRDQVINIVLKKLETQNEIELFNELDGNKNQQISFFELKSFLLKNGLKINSDDNLITFLQKFDQNKDNQINLKEFFDYLGLEKFRTVNQSQQFYEPPTAEEQNTEIIEKVQRALLNYMKEKRLTFYDMYIQMDKDRSKYISKQEFKTFLDTRIHLKLKESEFNSVWNFFDESPDGKLSVKEFNDSLKKKAENYESKKLLFAQGSRESLQLNQSLVSRILQQFQKVVEKNNTNFGVLFSKIDKDGNGKISQDELQQYLNQEMELNLSYQDFDQLFRRFDANYDDCISVTEFKKVFEEENERMDKIQKASLNAELIQSVQIDNNFVKATHIHPKFFDYLRANSSNIYIYFQHLNPSSSWIDKQPFKKKIFEEFRYFQSEESKVNINFKELELSEFQIDSMIGYTQSGNQKNEVNYVKFSEFFKDITKIDDTLVKKIKEQNQTKQLAEDTFKRIQKILTERNMTQKMFFDILDLNKDNRLSLYELQTAFTQMQLKIPRYDVEQIFKMIDISNAGEIKFNEFQKAFLELTSS